MKVLALDYGKRRTGVAVSDATGTLARPVGVVERVTSERGMTELCAIIEREAPELVLVGMPLTLRGEHGPQAQETAAFVTLLKGRCRRPILTEDERFTTKVARQAPGRALGRAADDPAAAAVLLQGYLDRSAGSGAAG